MIETMTTVAVLPHDCSDELKDGGRSLCREAADEIAEGVGGSVLRKVEERESFDATVTICGVQEHGQHILAIDWEIMR